MRTAPSEKPCFFSTGANRWTSRVGHCVLLVSAEMGSTTHSNKLALSQPLLCYNIVVSRREPQLWTFSREPHNQLRLLMYHLVQKQCSAKTVGSGNPNFPLEGQTLAWKVSVFFLHTSRMFFHKRAQVCWLIFEAFLNILCIFPPRMKQTNKKAFRSLKVNIFTWVSSSLEKSNSTPKVQSFSTCYSSDTKEKFKGKGVGSHT